MDGAHRRRRADHTHHQRSALPTPKKRGPMSNKSAGGIVHKKYDELPPTTPADLDRLRKAMARSDARVKRDREPTMGSNPIRRDANGRIIKPLPSRIRSAILQELGRRKMTRYKLWKAAQENCPTLTQSAVYEFLRGFRQLGLSYIEAMLVALNLDVVASRPHYARKG